MSELDGRFEGQVSARDLRSPSRGGRLAQSVGASAQPVRGWDWEADELSPEERAELEQLRAERDALGGRVAELEASVAAASRREAALSDGLRRLSRAHWPRRRRIATELRRAGLLD